MTDNLMTRDEVAAHLGIKPNSVRDTLRRYGITEQRGYPRNLVENLRRPGRGARTDLTAKPEGETMNTTTAWINRSGRGWGLAHVLQPDSAHEVLGVEHAKTACGRALRVRQIVAAGFEDRCKMCASRVARTADTQEQT